jgi:8-oxo-dGTP pyrophosphatase MutT (NUDIX family)
VVEAGESPRAAARREVREELAIDVTIGSLLVIDWISAVPPRTDGLMLVYDGGTVDTSDEAAIKLAAGELNAYGFVDLDGAAGLVSERLERRIRVALRAKRMGRAIELEDGRPQIARELAVET